MSRNALLVAMVAALMSACATTDPVEQVAMQAQLPDRQECPMQTGSLIKPKPGQCLSQAGATYSEQEVENTGSRSLSEALWRLNTAVFARPY